MPKNKKENTTVNNSLILQLCLKIQLQLACEKPPFRFRSPDADEHLNEFDTHHEWEASPQARLLCLPMPPRILTMNVPEASPQARLLFLPMPPRILNGRPLHRPGSSSSPCLLEYWMGGLSTGQAPLPPHASQDTYHECTRGLSTGQAPLPTSVCRDTQSVASSISREISQERLKDNYIMTSVRNTRCCLVMTSRRWHRARKKRPARFNWWLIDQSVGANCWGPLGKNWLAFLPIKI